MRRLMVLLLVLSAVVFGIPGNSSASSSLGTHTFHSSSLAANAQAHHGRALPLKSTCSSDGGDTCICGKGKLCVSGDAGCACIPAN
jgi:hypothetical protein